MTALPATLRPMKSGSPPTPSQIASAVMPSAGGILVPDAGKIVVRLILPAADV